MAVGSSSGKGGRSSRGGVGGKAGRERSVATIPNSSLFKIGERIRDPRKGVSNYSMPGVRGISASLPNRGYLSSLPFPNEAVVVNEENRSSAVTPTAEESVSKEIGKYFLRRY